MKAQGVRLADVMVIGPFMLYVATRNRPLEPWEQLTMGLLGVATIVYNGRNYLALIGRRGPHE